MWGQCFRRSWRDTLRFMGGPQVALAVLAIPAVGFLLHWSIDGARQAADEIHMWVIYGLAATGIVFATIFLWNLLWSPYRVERDRRKSLEAEVSKL